MVYFLGTPVAKYHARQVSRVVVESLYKEIKMKKFASVIITASVLFTGMASASVTTYEKADSSLATELCVAVAEGKASTIKGIMKSYKMTPSKITDKLHCNGMPVAEFAKANGKNGKRVARVLKTS